MSWARLERALAASGSVAKQLGDVFGPCWGVLGGSAVTCGRLWKLPGAILKAMLKDFFVS